MYSLVTKIARTVFILIFDFYQAVKGYIELALGHHNIVYADRLGGLHRKEDYRRVAVVAIYPEVNALPFLTNLLTALAEHDFFILVVSTARLNNQIESVILPRCSQLIERYPMGRDFGSYRLGLRWIEHQSLLKDIDTIALVNDSLFYPKGIHKLLGTLLARNEDWIALFENFQYHYHAQSFFQIFRKPVYSSAAFRNFWRKYRPFSARKHSINKGEVGLSLALRKGGFLPNTYFASGRVRQAVHDRLLRDHDSSHLNFIVHLSGAESYFAIQKRYAVTGHGTGAERMNNAITVPALQSESEGDNAEPEGNNGWQAPPSIPPDYLASEIAGQLGILSEAHNPTHQVGLLCNYLFTAPIKRDICYREHGDSNRGMHSIADVVALASGFDETEIHAMERDLRSKGVPATFRGLRRVLFKVGRL